MTESATTPIAGARPAAPGRPTGSIPLGIEGLVKKATVDPAFRAALLARRAEVAADAPTNEPAGMAIHRPLLDVLARVAQRMQPARIATALSILATLILFAPLTASHAEANAGPPYYTNGQVAAEPSGMTGLAISRETLIIDMRGLSVRPEYERYSRADSPEIQNPIDVSATYSITNVGPPREVALIFASGAPATAEFAVTLDGQPIAAQPAMSVTVPADWLPPKKAPGLDGGELNYLGPANAQNGWAHYPETAARSLTSTYAFTVTIPADDSVLAVRYKAEPQVYVTGGYVSTLNSYQFAYVLAPARAWDGFGGLDVTVHLPACWLAASRPALTREGEKLTGSFDAVPADALAFTVAPCDAVRSTGGLCAPIALVLPLAAFGVLRRGSRSSF